MKTIGAIAQGIKYDKQDQQGKGSIFLYMKYVKTELCFHKKRRKKNNLKKTYR
jgi:hypothetical protein